MVYPRQEGHGRFIFGALRLRGRSFSFVRCPTLFEADGCFSPKWPTVNGKRKVPRLSVLKNLQVVPVSLLFRRGFGLHKVRPDIPMASFINSEAKGEQDVQPTFTTHGRVGPFVTHHRDCAFVLVLSERFYKSCHGAGVQYGCPHDRHGRLGSVE